jgi:hypothetical protein
VRHEVGADPLALSVKTAGQREAKKPESSDAKANVG